MLSNACTHDVIDDGLRSNVSMPVCAERLWLHRGKSIRNESMDVSKSMIPVLTHWCQRMLSENVQWRATAKLEIMYYIYIWWFHMMVKSPCHLQGLQANIDISTFVTVVSNETPELRHYLLTPLTIMSIRKMLSFLAFWISLSYWL